jgi:oxygen-dependent protoporphyrinogen oxidase
VRLVVVGAGIAGLSAAREATHRAERLGMPLELTVLEADDRPGGVILTEGIDGTAFEWGPDSFVASKPAARDLARELGLDLVPPATSRASLLVDGELRPFPTGLVMGVPRGMRTALRAARTRTVSTGAALRAGVERLLPGSFRDEPVASLARRRLGTAWSSRLVEPLVEGVFGAPADRLGSEATLPAFAGARSLVAAARRTPPPSDPAFLSIRGGMGRLIDGLVPELPSGALLCGVRALTIEPFDTGYVVRTETGSVPTDAIVLALPAPAAGGMLEGVARSSAEQLGRIAFSSSAVALLRFRREDVALPLDGSGYLVPRTERRAHAACSWFSSKWPDSAPGTDHWIRAVVTSPEELGRDPQAIATRVADEVGSIIRATAPPIHEQVRRWDPALPIYEPGHLRLVASIEDALPAGIAVAGASYRGVGIPDCIASGRAAAARVVV